MRICHLYLLVHANKTCFKIGVANDVHQRGRTIDEDLLFEKSFVATGLRSACFKAEGALHRLLHKHRLPSLGGCGGTEWFAIVALDLAVKALESFGDLMGLGSIEQCPLRTEQSALASRKPRAGVKRWDTTRKIDREIDLVRYAHEIGTEAFSLYAILCSLADKSAVTRVTQDELVEPMGLSKDRIGFYIGLLSDSGWIESRRVGRVNEYHMKAR